jgi:hypothetical protein
MIYPLSNNLLYLSYLSSKKYTNFSKVHILVKTCRILGIEENVYDLLDLVWIKNKEAASLIYDLFELKEWYTAFQSQLNKSYKDYVKDNSFLEKIHISVDNFIFFDESSSIEDRYFFY